MASLATRPASGLCAPRRACAAMPTLPARATSAASTSSRCRAAAAAAAPCSTAAAAARRCRPAVSRPAAEGASGGPPAPSPTREEAEAAAAAAAASAVLAAKPKGQRIVIDLDDDEEDVAALKRAEAERLRSAEKFMVVGSGEAKCRGCGYDYTPAKGDPDFPVAQGTAFQDTPQDYCCPVCGAPRASFESRVTVVAGFAENQGYGLGTNSMTGGQKSGLIYGALAVFFLLFLAGYGLE